MRAHKAQMKRRKERTEEAGFIFERFLLPYQVS
jgi:hypothetical protein